MKQHLSSFAASFAAVVFAWTLFLGPSAAATYLKARPPEWDEYAPLLSHEQGSARYLGGAGQSDVYECANGWWLVGPGRRFTKAPQGQEVISFAENLYWQVCIEKDAERVREEGGPQPNRMLGHVAHQRTPRAVPTPGTARGALPRGMNRRSDRGGSSGNS